MNLSTTFSLNVIVGVILVLNNRHVTNESAEKSDQNKFSSDNSSTIFSIVSQLRQAILDGNQEHNQLNFQNCEDSQFQELLRISGEKKKKVIATWSKEEIKKLEQLVKEYGTDFAIVASKLGKSRDQVKRKFKIMQKKVSTFGFH